MSDRKKTMLDIINDEQKKLTQTIGINVKEVRRMLTRIKRFALRNRSNRKYSKRNPLTSNETSIP